MCKFPTKLLVNHGFLGECLILEGINKRTPCSPSKGLDSEENIPHSLSKNVHLFHPWLIGAQPGTQAVYSCTCWKGTEANDNNLFGTIENYHAPNNVPIWNLQIQ